MERRAASAVVAGGLLVVGANAVVPGSGMVVLRVLFVASAGSSGYSRYQDGQTLRQSAFGGAGDALGVTAFGVGLNNHDPFTQQYVGLGPFDQGQSLDEGGVQIAGLATAATADIVITIRGFQTPTGTVWDSVTATQPLYEGAPIPRSFKLATEEGSFWVHGNATEHLAEMAGSVARRGMSPEYVGLVAQEQILSLQAAVEAAARSGGQNNVMYNVGGWELKFAAPRRGGKLVVLIHALYKE